MPNKNYEVKIATYVIVFGSFLSIIFLSCDKIQGGKTKEQGQQDSIVAKIDSIANYYLSSNKVAGFSIAVLQDRDTLYAKGFGYSNLENKTPVTTETIFPMASISKLVTSVASMKLVEEGKLSLENILFEILPDFPRSEQAKKIKIKHLLSHTSGLADYAAYGDSLFLSTNLVLKKQDYYHFFENNELLFEPGTRFSYSNSGFVLMGFVIEQLSGMSYEDFIEQNISQPLRLSTLKHLNRNKESGTSIRYDLADSSFIVSMMDTVYYFKGDGGLSATALDLARLPFELVDGNILSEQSLNTMIQTTQFPDESISDYGLGVRNGMFEGNRVWGHTGGHINYWSTLAFFPEKSVSVVVFANTDLSPVDALKIEGEVALAVLGKQEPDLENLALKEADLSVYIGEYANLKEAYVEDDTVLIMQYEDDKNHLYRAKKNNTSKGLKLYFLGNHTFASKKYPMDRIVFDINTQGKVVGFRDYYNGLYMQMGKRIK